MKYEDSTAGTLTKK